MHGGLWPCLTAPYGPLLRNGAHRQTTDENKRPSLSTGPFVLQSEFRKSGISAEIISHPPKHLRRCRLSLTGSVSTGLAQRIAALTHPAYQRRRLQRVPSGNLKSQENSSRGGFRT